MAEKLLTDNKIKGAKPRAKNPTRCSMAAASKVA